MLESLDVAAYSNVIVLSDDLLDPLTADSRVLVTLLHLRDMLAKRGRSASIVSEMRDDRDRALAQLTKADDFVVSEQLVSLLMTQISENRHLESVFTDLFDPDGAEIYVRPSSYYLRPVAGLTFATAGRGGPPARRGRHRLPDRRARRRARRRAQPRQGAADAADRPPDRARPQLRAARPPQLPRSCARIGALRRRRFQLVTRAHPSCVRRPCRSSR